MIRNYVEVTGYYNSDRATRVLVNNGHINRQQYRRAIHALDLQGRGDYLVQVNHISTIVVDGTLGLYCVID